MSDADQGTAWNVEAILQTLRTNGGRSVYAADLIEAQAARIAELERDEAQDIGGVRDEAAFFCIDEMAKALGVDKYTPCDGTETWDGDVSGTIHAVLQAAGVIDEETGVLATARAKAAEAERDKLRAALEPFAKAAELFEPIGYGTPDMLVYSPAGGPEFRLTGAHLIAARAALAPTQSNAPGTQEAPDA